MKASFFRLFALAAITSCATYQPQCVQPALSVNGWTLRTIDKWPQLSFRLPPEFQHDYPLGPWFGPGNSQVAIQLARQSEEPLFVRFPTSRHRPEYTRCVGKIGGRQATIVSYNLREDVGDLAFIGPFQIYARIELPNHERVLVYGSTEDRTFHNQLLAALRTIRVSTPQEVRPKTR